MKTYEIRQYTDEEGKAVTARVTIDPETLTEFNGGPSDIEFFGAYSIPHPQMGQMRMQFEFPEGWSLAQCFENFTIEAEKHFKAFQEEMKKEAAASKLWTPGGNTNDKGGLLVPK